MHLSKIHKMNIRQFFKNLLYTMGILLVATVFALCLTQASNIQENIVAIYMLAVVIIATITNGYFWGILASVAGIIGVNYFFTYPYFAINFLLDGYPITFLTMLLISCIISALMGKIINQALLASGREKRFESLYNINKDLLTTYGMDNIIDLMLSYFTQLGHCSAVYYNNDPINSNIIRKVLLDPSHEMIFRNKSELLAAHQAFDSRLPTGIGRQACPEAQGLYIPIVSASTTYGLIGILVLDENIKESDTLNFFDVMALQFVLAMDRQTLFDEQQEILIETEKEKMRSNLLRAISHDLRTPLTCIQGSSATLLENKDTISPKTHDKLLTDIHQDCQWLIHMIENLLSVTRISDKTASVKKVSEVVEEVVSEAIARIKKRFPSICIEAEVPMELLIVPMDATLIEQVIINLVENSIHHSKTTKPISLTVEESENGNFALFKVSDEGVGIPEQMLDKIFDGKSERNYHDSSRGIGIGLSICKSIILAHGGTIEAINNKSGGVTFQFTLPLKGAL